MKVSEAIKQLDTMWKMLTSAYDDIADSHVAAYTMAVDALKAQGTCDDAVSRQTLQKELALYPIDDVTTEDEAGYNRAINDVQKMVLHLPSVQPEPIRINLNEPIKVKLTDWGKEIYYHQYDRTNQIAGKEICKPKFPKEDKNGYTEFQLWCFIELYGEHMGMILPNVIEPLEIVYER